MNWLKESTYPKDKSSIFNEKTESQQFLHIINQSRRNSPYEIDFRKSFPSQEIFFSEKRKKAVEEVDLLFSNRKLSSQGESILLNEADSSKNISEGMKQSTSFVMLLNDSLSSSSSGDNRGKARERRLVSNENEDSWFSENYLRNKEENSEFIVRFFSCQEIEVELLTKPENTTTFNDFIFIKLISKGAFGRVWLVKRKITENYYAMKIINFADKMTNNNLNMLKNESQVYKILKGDQFVSAIFTFSHENFICFVMEYMYGGDLGALLQKEIYFSEETARFYIAEIIEAVETLHNIKIIHRDLKPDNVLIDRNGHLKLTDFGLSDLGVLIQKELCAKTLLDSSKDGNQFLNKMRFSSSEDIQHCFSDQIDKFPSQREINKEDFNQLKSHDNLSSDECFGGRISNKSVKSKSKVVNIVGTPDYMSPEVINGTSLKDPGIDWWSVGVILFEFLTGIPPFNDESPEKIFENILEHKIPWDNTNIGYEEGCITPEAQDLINKLLEKNPKKRLGSKGVNEIKNHIFFKGITKNKKQKSKFKI